MVPVVRAQVGCVAVAVGTLGAVGTAFTVKAVAVDTQVLSAVLRTVRLYAPGVRFAKVKPAW